MGLTYAEIINTMQIIGVFQVNSVKKWVKKESKEWVQKKKKKKKTFQDQGDHPSCSWT